MNYEVKDINRTGVVSDKDENTSIQHFNIKFGAVGCDHEIMFGEQTVPYEFANTMSKADVTALVPAWAAAWLVANYPNT